MTGAQVVVAKVGFLILSIGLVACSLLALRQLRTQAAHELAQSRLRILHRDNDLWRVRTRIAEGTTPKRVQAMAGRMSGLQPITPELAQAGRAGGGGAAQVARAPEAPAERDGPR